MGYPYKELFHKLERSLIEYGSAHRPERDIREALDAYKNYKERDLDDPGYYAILVDVAFYSGFKAAIVEERHKTIEHWLADYRTVAEYGSSEVEEIMSDAGMIRNRRKIKACIANAKVMREVIAQHWSFADYIASFQPAESFENLLLLKEELEARFEYLGGITVYHFLMEIGLDVLKPDRVIGRIFHRLALTEYERQYLKTVLHGRRFARATGLPIRYIDIVLVAYGQASFMEFGIDHGICLDNPRCEVCGIKEYCSELKELQEKAAEEAS